MDWLAAFSIYLDMYGFPGNLLRSPQVLEFGDSAQRLGMIRLAEKYAGYKVIPEVNNDEVQYILIMRPSEPVRHWNADHWYGRNGSMSRDNATSLIASSKLFAKGFWWRLRERYFFFWNTNDLEGNRRRVLGVPMPPDFISLPVLGAFFRTLNKHKWALLLTDIKLVIDSLWQVIIIDRFKPEHTSDDLNHVVLLMQSRYESPTIFSRLANWIYFKYANKDDLPRYFRKRDKMTPPPIDKLYLDWFKKEGIWE